MPLFDTPPKMTFPLILFSIGLVGFAISSKSPIGILLALELMLLGATVLVLITSTILEDTPSSLIGLIVITVAGAESAIGLSLVVALHSLRGSIQL